MSRPMVCFLIITLVILYLTFIRRQQSFLCVRRLIQFTIHLLICFTPLRHPIRIFIIDPSISTIPLLYQPFTLPTLIPTVPAS